MKIIFLDIDGVLNVCYPKDRDKYGSGFHPHFVENLRHIIQETGAKIVISSSWRMSGLDTMINMWKYRKYPGIVIDVTPNLCYNSRTDDIGRGDEILAWYKDHFKYIDSFVIIDDDTDMLDIQKRYNFVQTSNVWDHSDHVQGYGLTTECAKQAIKILNRN